MLVLLQVTSCWGSLHQLGSTATVHVEGDTARGCRFILNTSNTTCCYSLTVCGGEETSVGESGTAPTSRRDGCRGEMQCLKCMSDAVREREFAGVRCRMSSTWVMVRFKVHM